MSLDPKLYAPVLHRLLKSDATLALCFDKDLKITFASTGYKKAFGAPPSSIRAFEIDIDLSDLKTDEHEVEIAKLRTFGYVSELDAKNGHYLLLLEPAADAHKLVECQTLIDENSVSCILDADFNIKFANENFYEKSGLQQSEVLGKHASILIPDIKANWRGIANINNKLWLSVFVKPIAADELSKNEFILIGHDITKEIEASIKAEEAMKSKALFFAKASHELRTPLNAIINFNEMVLEDFDEAANDEKLRATLKDYLFRVKNNSTHLLDLVNGLLTTAKLDGAEEDVKLSAQNIAPIIQEACDNIASLPKTPGVEFSLELPKEPIFALTNKQALSQILLNLLSNALKYTSSGFVSVKAVGFGGDTAAITIEDSGRGMPKDKLNVIFDPFVQLNSDDMGSGLGLSVVKDLCKALNIDIGVQSQEGYGTVFTLKFKRIAL